MSAWLADAEYEYWQNAFDPLEFRSAGRSFEPLRTKSNGLPYPLEQTIIDTSTNPGRRILRDCYIEVMGSVMWFGPEFWPLVGAKKDDIEHLAWVKSAISERDVVRVESALEPFVTAEGESGEIQQKLRKVIFFRNNNGAAIPARQQAILRGDF